MGVFLCGLISIAYVCQNINKKNMEVILLIIGIVAIVALAKSIKELDKKEDEFTNRFEE